MTGRDKNDDKQTFLNIPSDILQDKELKSLNCKAVLAEILWLDSLSSTPGCWKTNKNIAEFLGISESTVSNYVGELEKLGRIRRVGRGKDRVLYSNLIFEQPIKDSEVDHQPTKNSEDDMIKQPIKDSEVDHQPIKDSEVDTKDQPTKNSGQPTKNSGQPTKLEVSTYGDVVPIDHKDHIRSKEDNNLVAEKKSATSPPSNSSKSKSQGSKRRGRKKSTIVYEQDSIPYQLAEYYWAAQLVWDEKVHPEFKDLAKLEPCLQTWADEFDTLLTKQQLNSEEVEQVILFVLSNRLSCYTGARYSAGYLAQHYLTLRDMMLEKPVYDSRIQTAILPHDPDRELTQLITEKYRRVYRPGGSFPNSTAQKHFRLVSTKAKKRYRLDSVAQKTNFVEELFHIARDVWSSKGDPVMPWDLSGTLMWDYKMPQYYQNMGVPESTIGEIGDSSINKDEFEVEVMPEQKKVVEESDFNL